MSVQATGLLRRFGAIVYDGLLLFALLILATAPFVPITPANEIPQGPLESVPTGVLHQVLLLVVVFSYFVGFWAWRGRTLGMQSWGLQLETAGHGKPGIRACALRFAAALLSCVPAGLGFAWQLWDRDHLAWHDRLSGTRLIHYPKTKVA